MFVFTWPLLYYSFFVFCLFLCSYSVGLKLLLSPIICCMLSYVADKCYVRFLNWYGEFRLWLYEIAAYWNIYLGDEWGSTMIVLYHSIIGSEYICDCVIILAMLKEWVSEWVSVIMGVSVNMSVSVNVICEWVNEWVSEWMSERKRDIDRQTKA